MGRMKIPTIVIQKNIMKIMKIEHLISISGSILVVYLTSDRDYQYEIYFGNGMLYQPQEIYQTAHQAKTVGIESVKTVIGH